MSRIPTIDTAGLLARLLSEPQQSNSPSVGVASPGYDEDPLSGLRTMFPRRQDARLPLFLSGQISQPASRSAYRPRQQGLPMDQVTGYAERIMASPEDPRSAVVYDFLSKSRKKQIEALGAMGQMVHDMQLPPDAARALTQRLYGVDPGEESLRMGQQRGGSRLNSFILGQGGSAPEQRVDWRQVKFAKPDGSFDLKGYEDAVSKTRERIRDQRYQQMLDSFKGDIYEKSLLKKDSVPYPSDFEVNEAMRKDAERLMMFSGQGQHLILEKLKSGEISIEEAQQYGQIEFERAADGEPFDERLKDGTPFRVIIDGRRSDGTPKGKAYSPPSPDQARAEKEAQGYEYTTPDRNRLGKLNDEIDNLTRALSRGVIGPAEYEQVRSSLEEQKSRIMPTIKKPSFSENFRRNSYSDENGTKFWSNPDGSIHSQMPPKDRGPGFELDRNRAAIEAYIRAVESGIPPEVAAEGIGDTFGTKLPASLSRFRGPMDRKLESQRESELLRMSSGGKGQEDPFAEPDDDYTGFLQSAPKADKPVLAKLISVRKASNDPVTSLAIDVFLGAMRKYGTGGSPPPGSPEAAAFLDAYDYLNSRGLLSGEESRPDATPDSPLPVVPASDSIVPYKPPVLRGRFQ